MKYLIYILFSFSLFHQLTFSQWQPDVRLTINPFVSNTSFNNAWCIAANGPVVHVVWFDNRDGNYEIYYKRSADGGISWGADTRLTNNSARSHYPSVSVSGQVVHVVWDDERDGNTSEIYYKRSADGGISWGADTRLTNNFANSWNPSISLSITSATVHVAWRDVRDGNWEIYYKRSPDGGISWQADTRLTNNSAVSYLSSVAVSGSVVHVVWFDERDGNWEIYYKRSTDGGISWQADTRLTNNSAVSEFPSVSVSGAVVHVTWDDWRDGNKEIYYKRSTDAGISWGADTRLTNASNDSWYPSVSVYGQVVHVVWHDNRDNSNPEIYYKRSTDGGNNWETDTRLTNNSAASRFPSVAVSGQVVHVAWFDARDGNAEIYYKLNPTGNVVGLTNINSEIPNQFSLSQNYPNPFNPTTNFEFRVADFGLVNLTIYDATGRELTTLVNQELKPGTYKADWSAVGGASKYTSGVYFYRLSAGEFTETKKMILIK